MLSFVCLQTIKTEGILALYKGFIPIWVRLGPWNIIVSLVLIFDFEAMGIMNCTMTVYWEIFAKFNFGPFCLHCLGKFKTNLRYQNQLERTTWQFTVEYPPSLFYWKTLVILQIAERDVKQ